MNFIKKIKKHIKEKINKSLNPILFYQKKNILEQNILFCRESGVTSKRYCDHDIIVSLTTYSKRLYEVHLTIESIMEQTMKANRIILWLDYSLQNKPLPKALLLLQKRGLEILYCEDIRSYKKLIPALELFPDDAIITIDDDLIYEFDLLENLITPYIENKSYIYCHRYHRMRLDTKGNLLPYTQWEWQKNTTEAHVLNFPTSGAGTLFPPHSLDEEVLNKNVFIDICKYADDVWFKAMALKKGTLIKKVYSHSKTSEEYMENPNNQDIGLFNINVHGESLNDKQIKDVFTKYNLYSLLVNLNK